MTPWREPYVTDRDASAWHVCDSIRLHGLREVPLGSPHADSRVSVAPEKSRLMYRAGPRTRKRTTRRS